MFNSVPRVYSQTEEAGSLLNGELIHDVINSSLGARGPSSTSAALLLFLLVGVTLRWRKRMCVCVKTPVIGLFGNVLELLCYDYITEKMQINGSINELKRKKL